MAWKKWTHGHNLGWLWNTAIILLNLWTGLTLKKMKLLFDNNIQIYQESELKFCMF